MTTLPAARPFQPPFDIADGYLSVGGQRLAELIERCGTPCYLYAAPLIDARIARVRAILPATFDLHYAIKANPLPSLLQHLAGRVDGFDIASGGELERALAAGMSAAHIGFAGPGKRREELVRAVAAGVLIHAESTHELDSLADIAATQAAALPPPRIALRINPDFILKGAGMRMGGGPRPFGIDAEAIPKLLADWPQRYRRLDFCGFHLYAGSQNLDGAAIAATQRAAYALVVQLARNAPAPLHIVNLGGGFGIPYFPHEKPLELAPIRAALADIAADAAHTLPTARLCLELGRYLVGEAGLYVARVLDKKVSRGHTFLVVDGGLHHHLAATGNFGQTIRRNFPVAIDGKVGAGATACVSVVGPLCTPLDLLADHIDLPDAGIGDLFVIFQSGAYGASASPQAFLGHPPPQEALIF